MTYLSRHDRGRALNLRIMKNAGTRLTNTEQELVNLGYTFEAARREARRRSEMDKIMIRNRTTTHRCPPTTEHHTCTCKFDLTAEEQIAEILHMQQTRWTLQDTAQALGMCERCILALAKHRTTR